MNDTSTQSQPRATEGVQAKPACVVCDRPFGFHWTDTHGIGCCDCGAAYRIFHYVDDKRVDRPPESLTRPEWVPLLRRYHAEIGRMIPHGFDMRLSGRSTYSGLTSEDYRAFNAWCDANKDSLPNPEPEEPEPAALQPGNTEE